MNDIRFLLFEISSIEFLVKSPNYQSYEFGLAQQFISSIFKGEAYEDDQFKSYKKNDGLFFIGEKPSVDKQFLLFDLLQCDLINIERNNHENILIVLQKAFRAAIHFWRNQPFTSSERVNHTKLIIFPFRYNMNGQNKRLVLERQPGTKKLTDLGIKRPLLAYKYNDEDVSAGANEVANINILEEAGICLLSILESEKSIIVKSIDNDDIANRKPMTEIPTGVLVDGNEGFKYMNLSQKKLQLTEYQKKIVDNMDILTPIRVDGPAGTGKTMSLILRAYNLLHNAKMKDEQFHIVFFAHSESTKYEIEEAFSINDTESFLDGIRNKSKQTIEIVTLLEWCRKFVGFEDQQLTDLDASTAKEFQRLLIHDACSQCYKKNYATYAPHLSARLKKILEPIDEDETFFTSLDYMLQHEFSIQIKGRANSDLEQYKKLTSLQYGLPVLNEKDKEYIYSIYREYQGQLDDTNQYDTDDVVIEAISRFNAPRWRRERITCGYDYIFVDEMHLFNSNEQCAFHYLSRDVYQQKVPICFALDYSQAIGDRGDVMNDYIETAIAKDALKQTYQTVFRSSQEITDFCASIVASGTQFFESGFHNPYRVSVSGLSEKERRFCKIPELYMYENDDEMFSSIKRHLSSLKREFGSDCNNYEMAVISFSDTLLQEETAKKIMGRDFFILKSRNAKGLSGEVKNDNQYVLSSPYNINGLEFKCVILVGVDEGRVPQTNGTNDISSNYLRYTALNQLYLCCSRAKYRVILIGNKLHGISTCLHYPLKMGTLINKTQD